MCVDTENEIDRMESNSVQPYFLRLAKQVKEYVLCKLLPLSIHQPSFFISDTMVVVSSTLPLLQIVDRTPLDAIHPRRSGVHCNTRFEPGWAKGDDVRKGGEAHIC